MRLLTLLLSISLLAACTADKPKPALPYGTDRDLLLLSEYDGKEFDLTTLGAKSNNPHLSSTVKITDESKEIQFFETVEYKTDAALMDDSPFLGQPQRTYKIRYALEGTKLTLYKVGKKSDFSYEELPIAEQNNLWASPILSYDVSYFSLEETRDAYGDKTSILSTVPQDNKNVSTHFKLNKNSKTLAKFLRKDLLFKSDFFNGDWYLSSTIIHQNYDLKSGGERTLLEWYARVFSKVRYKKSEGKIVFYSLNMDPRLKKDIAHREDNQLDVLQIKTEWMDYQMAPVGKSKSVIEEKNESAPWDQRKYVKLDLTELTFPFLDNAAKTGYNVSPNMKLALRDIQLGQSDGRKYISFKVYSEQLKATLRVALLEAKTRDGFEKYQEKVYFKSDEELFGFFWTDKELLDNSDQQHESFQMKSHLVNRFNPKLESIVFHPSEQTPEWSFPLAKSATESWNQAFAKAGVKTKILFSPEKVSLGDSRYNIINIINDPDGNDPWWGFGPSIADSETGEIVSATANLNISNMIQYTRSLLQGYLRSKQDGLNRSSIYSFVAGRDIGRYNLVEDIIQFALPIHTTHWGFGEKQLIPVLDTSQARSYKWVKSQNSTIQDPHNSFSYRSEGGFGLVFPNINAEINSYDQCLKLKNYSETLASGQRSLNPEQEAIIIEPCARAILAPRVTNTLLHEMGHNFGLRHNFYGNNDVKNFNEKSKVSSVMEYPDFDETTLAEPGPYDIAAIQWGYAEKLMAPSNELLLNYNPELPINDQDVARSMKSYKYCSDESARSNNSDPLCSLHDKGVSALETVENYIKRYSHSLASRMNIEAGRIVKVNELSVGQYNFQYTFLPLKRFYDYYRHLLKQELPHKAYLETEDKASYATLLNSVEDRLRGTSQMPKIELNSQLKDKLRELYKKDLSETEKRYVQFVDYRAAAQAAYDFLKNVAMMSDRYCVVQGQTNELLPFKALQNQVFKRSGITITSCSDKEASDYLSLTQRKVIAQAGYPLTNIKRSLDIKSRDLTPVAIGTYYDRAYALIALTLRSNTLLKQNGHLGFYPNFYDEPDKRDELENLILNRIKSGLDTKSLGIDEEFKKHNVAHFIFPTYSSEQPIINLMYDLMINGEMLPNSSLINSQRAKRFKVAYKFPGMPSNSSVGKVFEFAGSKYIAEPENEVSYQLVELNEKLNSLRRFRMPSVETLNKFFKLIIENAPAKGEPFTVGQLFKLNKVITEAQKKDTNLAKEQDTLFTYINPELKIFGLFIFPELEKISSQHKEDSPEYEKAENEFLQKDLSPILENLNIKDGLYKEDLQERFAKVSKQHIDKLVQYELNKLEIDAQGEILMNSLIRLKSESDF